jgi:DNA-binding NarL/FixJ family response regulator
VKLRVVLGLHSGLLRAALRALIEARPGFVVVGEAATVDALPAVLAVGGGDVVLVDGAWWDPPAPLLAEIARVAPAAAVVGLGHDRDAVTAHAALAAGAAGWLLADQDAADLFDALACARRGERYLARAAATPPLRAVSVSTA